MIPTTKPFCTPIPETAAKRLVHPVSFLQESHLPSSRENTSSSESQAMRVAQGTGHQQHDGQFDINTSRSRQQSSDRLTFHQSDLWKKELLRYKKKHLSRSRRHQNLECHLNSLHWTDSLPRWPWAPVVSFHTSQPQTSTLPNQSLEGLRGRSSIHPSTGSAQHNMGISSRESTQSVTSRIKKSCALPRGQLMNSRIHIFKCTFCYDSFRSKFEWERHEKTQHLDVEQWMCAPYGGRVVSEVSGRLHCAYCNEENPTSEHLDQHRHHLCQGITETVRGFRRKDHLVQHLRHFHHLETLPVLKNWRFEIELPSRCGFCNHRLATWRERADHLAHHFHERKTMADWVGGHEFPPSIAARVKNSIHLAPVDFEMSSVLEMGSIPTLPILNTVEQTLSS